MAKDQVKIIKVQNEFGGWVKLTIKNGKIISEETEPPKIVTNKGVKSLKIKYSKSSSYNINSHSQQIVFKNISTQNYTKSASSKINTEVWSATRYMADLNDVKNENGEIVELALCNAIEPIRDYEELARATSKEDKQELINHFDGYLNTINTEGKYKTATKSMMVSLPKDIKRKDGTAISLTEQEKLLKSVVVEAIADTPQYQQKPYLIAIHQDQKDHGGGGLHVHITIAYHGYDGSSLHAPFKKGLKDQSKEFNDLIVKKLEEKGIAVEYQRPKSKLTDELKRELTFVAYTNEGEMMVLAKDESIHILHSKDIRELQAKYKLQKGDKFDYCVTKTKTPKMKDGKKVYYGGKLQYETKRDFSNILRREELERSIAKVAEEAAEEKVVIKKKKPEKPSGREGYIRVLESVKNKFRSLFSQKQPIQTKAEQEVSQSTQKPTPQPIAPKPAAPKKSTSQQSRIEKENKERKEKEREEWWNRNFKKPYVIFVKYSEKLNRTNEKLEFETYEEAREWLLVKCKRPLNKLLDKEEYSNKFDTYIKELPNTGGMLEFSARLFNKEEYIKTRSAMKQKKGENFEMDKQKMIDKAYERVQKKIAEISPSLQKNLPSQNKSKNLGSQDMRDRGI